jgi:hypothetical protein
MMDVCLADPSAELVSIPPRTSYFTSKACLFLPRLSFSG